MLAGSGTPPAQSTYKKLYLDARISPRKLRKRHRIGRRGYVSRNLQSTRKCRENLFAGEHLLTQTRACDLGMELAQPAQRCSSRGCQRCRLCSVLRRRGSPLQTRVPCPAATARSHNPSPQSCNCRAALSTCRRTNKQTKLLLLRK